MGPSPAQALSAVLALAVAGALAAALILGPQGPSPWECAIGWFASDTPDDWGLLLVYMVLLSWDSLELLFAIVFVRWPSLDDRLARLRLAAAEPVRVCLARGLHSETGG